MMDKDIPLKVWGQSFRKYLNENLEGMLYLDVLILKFPEARSCWTAFDSFLSFDATTIAKWKYSSNFEP